MYPLTIRKRARDLFVEEGLHYDQVAKRLSMPSADRVKQWGSDEKWFEQRKDFQKQMVSLNSKVLMALSAVVDRIGESYEKDKAVSAQEIFAHGKAIEALLVVAALVGNDSSTTKILNVLAALNKHPRSLKKARRELMKGK